MRKRSVVIMMLTAACRPSLASEAQHGTLVGEIHKLDSAAKTVVVKLADGTRNTGHVVTRTSVRGAQEATAAGNEAFDGLKDGSEVAVHYTAGGTEDTANLIAAGTAKSAKATVHYSEETGRKVARFFRRKL